MFRVAVLFVFALCLAAQDRVVDNNKHGWFLYMGDHPFGNSRWGVHLEGQWRRHDVITRWQQLLLRPGVNFEVSRHVLLTGGYAFIRSHPYGDFPARFRTDEHRIWEQLLLRYKTGRTSWTSRFRFENRFLESYSGDPPAKSYRYENRFRVWQQARVPVSKMLYIAAYDEFWVYVKPYVSNSAFDQNRAYGALGFNLAPDWKFEAGYLNQAVLQRSGRVLESNHTIIFTLFSQAPFGRRGSANQK